MQSETKDVSKSIFTSDKNTGKGEKAAVYAYEGSPATADGEAQCVHQQPKESGRISANPLIVHHQCVKDR